MRVLRRVQSPQPPPCLWAALRLAGQLPLSAFFIHTGRFSVGANLAPKCSLWSRNLLSLTIHWHHLIYQDWSSPGHWECITDVSLLQRNVFKTFSDLPERLQVQSKQESLYLDDSEVKSKRPRQKKSSFLCLESSSPTSRSFTLSPVWCCL